MVREDSESYDSRFSVFREMFWHRSYCTFFIESKVSKEKKKSNELKVKVEGA